MCNLFLSMLTICENFKSFEKFSIVLTFSFQILITQKIIKNSTNASNKVPSRANYLSYEISCIKIGSFLLPEVLFTKNYEEKKYH